MGPLRSAFLAHFVPYAKEVVIAGHDRGYVTAMVFPDVEACRKLAPELPASASVAEVLASAGVRSTFASLLKSLAAKSTGMSTRFAGIILLDTPPSIDAHELTDKGSISQRAGLQNRAAVVEEMYASSPRVISADQNSPAKL